MGSEMCIRDSIMVEGFMNTDKIGEVVGSFGSLEIMDSLWVGEKSL